MAAVEEMAAKRTRRQLSSMAAWRARKWPSSWLSATAVLRPGSSTAEVSFQVSTFPKADTFEYSHMITAFLQT
ncbi:hypothetical protein GUJ93_ZPchr0011g27021 [Zizania palustris]|uniref:Uncharacterized protein n=1 Tax=Zizania palustris TaxID=103762 RepID=A0A8J6BSX9_ZIZPA|nr:hypothetical protein GUJ93_ZPchr0011g27021 [Zizania palustris]